ncbi:MAG: ribosome small subunit-dependent GTPase A [Desulfotomaculum sp.]|nr:ribosome small subunit-dependent GTPase A [Desulfotomaculum sp.]
MIEGIVVKAYSGYYYVHEGKNQWVCRLRGKFRLTKEKVLVGDRVIVNPAEKNTGMVYKVLERKNKLVRPPVANVDQAVITFAIRTPDPNLDLLDKLLIMAEGEGIKPVICINKVDLLSDGELNWLEVYRDAGYTVLVTSAVKNIGIKDLKNILAGKISVFAGPSGVGKSSLLNAIQPGLKLKTGDVSKKLKRGRHTTRHVELIPLESGGLVADTPGFSSLYLPDISSEKLAYYFPEFIKYLGQCRFSSCMHNKEPNCAVKDAVKKGEVSSRRYQSYLHFLDEIQERERRYSK